MTTASVTTTDHNHIWRWSDRAMARSAALRATESGDEPGMLRIRFRDESADDLEAIRSDEFFDGSRLGLFTRTGRPMAGPAGSTSSSGATEPRPAGGGPRSACPADRS